MIDSINISRSLLEALVAMDEGVDVEGERVFKECTLEALALLERPFPDLNKPFVAPVKVWSEEERKEYIDAIQKASKVRGERCCCPPAGYQGLWASGPCPEHQGFFCRLKYEK